MAINTEKISSLVSIKRVLFVLPRLDAEPANKLGYARTVPAGKAPAYAARAVPFLRKFSVT
jgi:hypothetical protein